MGPQGATTEPIGLASTPGAMRHNAVRHVVKILDTDVTRVFQQKATSTHPLAPISEGLGVQAAQWERKGQPRDQLTLIPLPAGPAAHLAIIKNSLEKILILETHPFLC